MDPESLRNAVRSALLQRAGLRTDSTVIAAATAATCRVLVAQLSPVIGSRGLEVLFKRVLYNARTDFPLQEAAAAAAVDATLTTIQRLTAFLASQPQGKAADLSTEFLAQFCELLTRFIGGPLTERLLAPVWGLPAPPPNRRLQDE